MTLHRPRQRAAVRGMADAADDGRYPKLLASFAKTDLLVLNDFGLAKLNSDHRRDLLEDRYASRPTLVTSQLPLAQWHELLADPTLADAILDRLVHNAYKLELKGGSMRKHHSASTMDAGPPSSRRWGRRPLSNCP